MTEEKTTEQSAPIERFYSASARGFFSSEYHLKAQMPVDAVPVTHDEWHALLEVQSTGKEIVPDQNGRPVAADPSTPPHAA